MFNLLKSAFSVKKIPTDSFVLLLR